MSAYDDGTLWDVFAAATITICTDEAQIVLAPGRRYVLPWIEPVHVITAWNPGRVVAKPVNDEANERLGAILRATGLSIYVAVGSSADGTWAEPGFAVVGLTRERAVEIGRAFGQVAIYELSTASVALIGCSDGRTLTRANPGVGPELED